MLIKIDTAQMRAIHEKLPRSKKKECAQKLGIHASALSRYLNNVKHNHYRLPQTIYQGIMTFINPNNDLGLQ